MNVGFIGLGRMGTPMARSLLRAGFPLTVYNRTWRRALQLGEAGVTVAESPAEVGRMSEMVVTMLADAEAVLDVACGQDGVLATLGDGAVLIDMSTTGPRATLELARAGARYGVSVLDAPVSGSVQAAQSATLTTIVGGERDAFERARPILGAMTSTQLWLGPSGAGAAMKLALNGMLAACNEALAEALVVAERSGIQRELAYDAIASSAVGSRYIEYKRAAFLEPSEEPVAFTLALMQKDLALYLELARHLGVPVASVAATDQILSAARRSQGDDADLAGVAVAIRELSAERTSEEAIR